MSELKLQNQLVNRAANFPVRRPLRPEWAQISQFAARAGANFAVRRPFSELAPVRTCGDLENSARTF